MQLIHASTVLLWFLGWEGKFTVSASVLIVENYDSYAHSFGPGLFILSFLR